MTPQKFTGSKNRRRTSFFHIVKVHFTIYKITVTKISHVLSSEMSTSHKKWWYKHAEQPSGPSSLIMVHGTSTTTTTSNSSLLLAGHWLSTRGLRKSCAVSLLLAFRRKSLRGVALTLRRSRRVGARRRWLDNGGEPYIWKEI